MKYAIIVAGGVGSRSGDSLPKQFHEIAGKPMLWWTLRAFHEEDQDTHLIVVMHPDYIAHWKEICGEDCTPHTVTPGGATRSESVLAGLRLIPDGDEGLVAVHDAARPLVSRRLISDGWNYAAIHKAALPGVAVADSLRKGPRADSIPVDRSEYFAVQTPQVFDKNLLKAGYSHFCRDGENIDFSDDATLMQRYGVKPYAYEGDPRNIKVTYPGDFLIAEEILKER
ncbi:MAG: 2-C-methyl-D-erythritol 4-phosphate cytidylyltransferase [Muribaculaceae bacterium]|nr:2-C-methyl-D-erythritol 4-phosphate cytidylyltransferase [Muribaculaceae bacterium]